MLLFFLKVKSPAGGVANRSQPAEERAYVSPFSSYSSFQCSGLGPSDLRKSAKASSLSSLIFKQT